MTGRVGVNVGVDWDSVDWTGRSDAEVAKSLGVTRSAASTARRERGVPAQGRAGAPERLRAVRVVGNYAAEIRATYCAVAE